MPSPFLSQGSYSARLHDNQTWHFCDSCDQAWLDGHEHTCEPYALLRGILAGLAIEGVCGVLIAAGVLAGTWWW